MTPKSSDVAGAFAAEGGASGCIGLSVTCIVIMENTHTTIATTEMTFNVVTPRVLLLLLLLLLLPPTFELLLPTLTAFRGVLRDAMILFDGVAKILEVDHSFER